MLILRKTVVITGGSSGIGFAAAKKFYEEGACVIITGRKNDRLQKAVAELENGSNSCLGIKADVSKKEDMEALFTRIRDEYKTIDVRCPFCKCWSQWHVVPS